MNDDNDDRDNHCDDVLLEGGKLFKHWPEREGGGRREGGPHDLSLKAAKPTDPAHFGYFG